MSGAGITLTRSRPRDVEFSAIESAGSEARRGDLGGCERRSAGVSAQGVGVPAGFAGAGHSCWRGGAGVVVHEAVTPVPLPRSLANVFRSSIIAHVKPRITSGALLRKRT